MIDPQTEALLRDVVQRESRSLLAYVRDAYPWATAEESQALETLRRLIQEEEQAVAALRELYQRVGADHLDADPGPRSEPQGPMTKD